MGAIDRIPGGTPPARPKTTETRRVVEQVTEGGRTATRVREWVTESDGAELPPARQTVDPGTEPGCLHALGAAVVAFAVVLALFSIFSSPDHHPLAVFIYWVVGFIVWGMLL